MREININTLRKNKDVQEAGVREGEVQHSLQKLEIPIEFIDATED